MSHMRYWGLSLTAAAAGGFIAVERFAFTPNHAHPDRIRRIDRCGPGRPAAFALGIAQAGPRALRCSARRRH